MKKFVLASFALALSISAFAADATGKWNGKFKMDLSGVKKMVQSQAKMTAEQKAQQMKQLDGAEKVMSSATIKMELKKDHTVSVAQTTNGKTKNDTAKWTQTGSKVRVFDFKLKDGGPTEMTGVISANGKTIVFDLSNEMKKQAQAKGAPAGFNGKMMITFTKA